MGYLIGILVALLVIVFLYLGLGYLDYQIQKRRGQLIKDTTFAQFFGDWL